MISKDEIKIPKMIGFDKLTKIIIAYLKVGGDKVPKGSSEVASMAKVSVQNVSRNTKFLEYVGLLEGIQGNYKLTENGKNYAQALDWGKLGKANSILKETLRNNTLVMKGIGFVDMHQPVSKDDLVSQIALISDKPKKPLYITGIRGFIEMLVTSGLLESDAGGNLTVSKEKKEEIMEAVDSLPSEVKITQPTKPVMSYLPITLSIKIDNGTDVNKLKEILKVIKDVFQEENLS